jgi:hypothetical protein
MMKTKIFAAVLVVLLSGSMGFSQPGQGEMKPAGLVEKVRMIDDRICQPLTLDQTQKGKVILAFKDFFIDMDKLIDFTTDPPTRPEKSKVDSLAKIRDEKVKSAIPEASFPKYLELEKETRPKGPGDEHARPEHK